jgi:hypothetical protein
MECASVMQGLWEKTAQNDSVSSIAVRMENALEVFVLAKMVLLVLLATEKNV